MKKERKQIAEMPYDDVDFRWISNHWDVHLNGVCMYEGKLCEFENDYPDYDEGYYNEEEEEWDIPVMMVRIYELSLKERWQWRISQWKFEKAVGYHWTYPHRARGKAFYYRKPQWLYKWLFRIYFRKNCIK